jgi:hypothetical protein
MLGAAVDSKRLQSRLVRAIRWHGWRCAAHIQQPRERVDVRRANEPSKVGQEFVLLVNFSSRFLNTREI